VQKLISWAAAEAAALAAGRPAPCVPLFLGEQCLVPSADPPLLLPFTPKLGVLVNVAHRFTRSSTHARGQTQVIRHTGRGARKHNSRRRRRRAERRRRPRRARRRGWRASWPRAGRRSTRRRVAARRRISSPWRHEPWGGRGRGGAGETCALAPSDGRGRAGAPAPPVRRALGGPAERKALLLRSSPSLLSSRLPTLRDTETDTN
jgi:hypothetical protein